MRTEDRLARIEDAQGFQAVLLIYIALNVTTAWSTGDVLWTLVGWALVALVGWLAWRLIVVLVRYARRAPRIALLLAWLVVLAVTHWPAALTP